MFYSSTLNAVSATPQQQQQQLQQQLQYQLQQEPLELQIDYWPIVKPGLNEKEKSQTKGSDQGKNSIKSTFRSLQVKLLICLEI